MKTFEECCKYLGIPIDLPKCYVREKQIQAAYKLRVCMMAWNKQDGFVPDETANYNQEGAGYTPHFYFKNGRLLSSRNASPGPIAGLGEATAGWGAAYTIAYFGLRICLKTRDRAVDFGKTFIDIFNELF